MATVGLKGIWGLEQLDKTGIATWKLGLILMGAAAVISYVLTKLLIGMEPNPIIGPLPPQFITAMTFGIVFFAAGGSAILLALARAVEIGLKALALVDDVIDASIERLRPKRALRFTCIALGLLYGSLQIPILISLDPQASSVIEFFTKIATGGPERILCFILLPINGLITGMLWAVGISQIRSLMPLMMVYV